MILKMVRFPDEFLRKKTHPVEEFNEELHTLLDNMFETMYEENGVGLAAPQVGKSLRLYILDDFSGPNNSNPMEIINPEFILKEGEVLDEEGCLSLPGEYAYVKRFEEVHVKYQNRFGEEKVLAATGRLARILQHEYDHLEGILFIDHLPATKREQIKKHIKKRIASGDYKE